MRRKLLYAVIAGCLLQSHALAEVARYQPSQPQQFYQHHQRLQIQRYQAPQGQSVYIPPQPTFVAPQPQRYVAPPQPNTVPQWHQRAQQHQVPQVGVPRPVAKHSLLPHNTAPNAAQQAENNYIKPWKRASEPNIKGNDLNVGLSVGYRVDELDWNIAGNLSGTTPNILSELEWTDVQMIELRGEADYLVNRSGLTGLYLEGNFNIANAISGDNQDSDYNGDNRTLEFSRSNNDASDSSASGYSLGVGYQFDIVKHPQRRFFITPLVGYESNIITMKMTDAVQTVETALVTPPLGPFAGLDSTYEAEWSGAYLGLKMGSVFGRHKFNIRGDYHLLGDYYAEAQWNLRTEPVTGFQQPLSYIHEGDSQGFALKADYAYNVYKNMDLFLSGWIKSFQMEDGLDTTYIIDGSIGQTKVNEANWTSSSLHAGLKWRF